MVDPYIIKASRGVGAPTSSIHLQVKGIHMNTEQVYHYVYRITNTVLNKHYYGKRSSKIKPELDLGIKYFSSSKDKQFKNDQKSNPQNYTYKIIVRCKTPVKALHYEVRLHNIFNVAINPAFYNKAKQTSTKFSTSGVASWIKGKKHTKETISKMSKAKKDVYKGALGNNAKLANLYDYTTGELLFSSINIADWCRQNPRFAPSSLYRTATCDRAIKSSVNNRHHDKNICALYLCDKDYENKEKIYLAGKHVHTN